MRLLKMIVLPLVIVSIISGMTNLRSSGEFKRVTLKMFCYLIITASLSVITGLTLVNLIHPGVGMNLPLPQNFDQLTAPKGISEILIKLIPDNIFRAAADFDMLGVIFFSMVFGFASNFVDEESCGQISRTVNVLSKVLLKITHVAIQLAPLGVFAMVTKVVAESGPDILRPMLPYMATVIAGLGIHAFISLPILALILARINPYKLMLSTSESLMMAFSTASSSATLPLTIDQAITVGGASPKIANFMLPLGSTIIMDGTALYECVSVLFLAQSMGIDLSIAQQATIFISAVLIGIGAAGIPHAGLVMMTVILSAVGLPPESAAIIWSVDRVLDMGRTAVNVWGNLVGCVIVSNSEKRLLAGDEQDILDASKFRAVENDNDGVC
jgi:proton glutamate symport protein